MYELHMVSRQAKWKTRDQILKSVEKELRQFGAAFVRDMQRYPPALPWKRPPPKKGPRRGGRRTGALGRGWAKGFAQASLVLEGNDAVYRILNDVPYMKYVQGRTEEQARHMGLRGWRPWNEVADNLQTSRFRSSVKRGLVITRGG